MSGTIRDTWPLPDSALKPALALALAIEHAPMGILMLRDEASGALEPVLGEGLGDDACSRFGPQKAGEGPVGVAYAEHRRVTIRDVTRNGDAASPLRDLAVLLGFRGVDVVPLVLADGSVIGAVAAFFPGARRPRTRGRDLAELYGGIVALLLDNARLRADAERRREIVEEISKGRMQFVARMSHELRTPLQSIAGYIDLLALGNPDPLTARQRRMLERVRVSERILIRVIDDLVGMARLESGRLDYNITAVPAHNAVSAAAVVIQPLAEQKKLRLEVWAGGPDVVCSADDTKLKQVLINLMANAVKFTPEGGTVRVACKLDTSGVLFEVSDSGPGIAPAKLATAFEPYVQLGDPATRIAGSGLGLAISREFAHGMGGLLTATSTPGKGSIFTLRLPRALTA